MDFQRQILKGLMNPYMPSSQRSFTDDEVCRHYLAGGFCPSELFVNTKSDLGPCDKIHDEHLREEYLKNSENDRYGWERDFYEYLQMLVNDLDRKIKKGKERVEMKVEESTQSKDEREEKIILLEDKIETIVKEVEKAGKSGNVKEAVKQLKMLEEKNTELATLKGDKGDSKNKKLMEVCEVCGAILVVNDCSQRLDAHLQGKQHSGYKRIREALEQNKVNSFIRIK
ncbi:LUC7-domain-containing protein [Piromyces finnis]|uniref:LUC7-domain-containing protein n=1 Tax=Piromyces finnis TaxID=1754191 RepID=A0A1Y1VBJ9_9FUNG|nr:LUC7-domain-containing protein [Piromyces finnis]|eukprot:ORX50626.1 LUC7-domain-containing protein [Piromyces finnis]